jgi:hypothetical protein
MVPLPLIACAPSPCGPAFPVSRLGGRYPADYYGHSVTRGLAPGRVIPRSHCRTYLARLRHPVRLPLMALSDIAPAPRRITAGKSSPCGRGRHRFQASFRWVAICTFWRLGFKQSSLYLIARVFPARRPDAWARPPVYWHAAVPGHFSVHGLAIRPTEHLLQSVPAARAILTVRFVAH